MFEDFTRERKVRRVLRALARQRVVIIVDHPDAPWVIERAVPIFEGVNEALRTCELRGWAHVLHDAVPTQHMSTDDLLDLDAANLRAPKSTPIFRLTEAGWAALNRTHTWLLATFAVTTAGLAASLVGVWLTWLSSPLAAKPTSESKPAAAIATPQPLSGGSTVSLRRRTLPLRGSERPSL
jgi:hypothetical protein